MEQTAECECVGGPYDGQRRTSRRLWLGFPGPWTGISVQGRDDGVYLPDNQTQPTKLLWSEWVKEDLKQCSS